ncbi:CBM35 domain-containing protein [Plantibacter sp. M259]|uniref:CBM35 domain-containing protein n=1 Tax=Plantibacter sp. M259 TaxID=2583822 RepID=UPI00197B9B70|nr:CBM35 domain-containing protein [Plantibacter sp. M259]
MNGTVDGDGRAVTATVRVTTPNELSIDVGQETGDFMGGASGTLYGLYGPGLPSNNLIDGIKLRTVATKAQDGPQHPGADALEIVKGLADSSDGDVYIYMTDTYRGFPYEVPGTTGQEKEADFAARISTQVDQVLELPAEYQDNVVFVPFNEPEGNMYGDGAQSFYGTSWLNDPTAYFANWDAMYRLIKDKMPEARIAGPNTSQLFGQVRGFLEHTVASDTVPDVITWHELSDPASIRRSVATYRIWEQEIFAGTERAGVELPINLNEYAFNYHTSVPAQMIQWIAALEDTKVDGDIAYWNIDGNLSDSAVQANRANGQWWLLNSYGNMTGKTVLVTPPSPNQSYTLQGVATHDAAKQQVKALFGGSAGGAQNVYFDRLPSDLGDSAHVLIREIRWTGQIADSSEPQTVAEFDSPVVDGSLGLAFGSGDLPGLSAESAYEVIVTPGVDTTSSSTPAVSWRGTYEAEAASHTGAPYYLNGPEGTPQNVGGFYTSGTRNVGGIETGSTLALDFTVDVPVAGTYDLTMLANAYNKEARNLDQGPVNMFIRVNGAAEQEVRANLGYKWVVWDRTDTTVDLQAGANTITIAAQNTDQTKGTSGAAIVDKIDLTLANPGHVPVYEAENAVLEGASTDYSQASVSGSGTAQLSEGQSAVFWVYNKDDSEKVLDVKTLGGGTAAVKVNGQQIADVSDSAAVPAFLVGGINRVEIVGSSGTLALDRIAVGAGTAAFATQVIEAESGVLSGAATISDLSLASDGKAVTAVGGAPGNGNTLQTNVTVEEAGSYAMTIRYSNEEQSPASHYNPDPVARRADISVNGGALQKVLFPQSFHQNQFWDLTMQVELQAGENTVTFASEEQPDFNGTSYISERYPELGLRSVFAPNLDRFTFTSLFPSAVVPEPGDATISVDRATVQAGSTVTVSGTGFEPDESIELVLNSDPVTLGTVTADASGGFRTTVTVPVSVPAGAHTLVATGAQSAREASTALAVTTAGSGGAGTDGSGTGSTTVTSSERAGGLASTGFGGLSVLLAGAMALAAGAALVARARERRAR